jgi:hypothetical protein
MFNRIILSLVISIIVFAFYVQFSPQIGGIWLRPNENGQTSFSLSSLFNLISSPLKYKEFWNINMWDVNYFVYPVITYASTFLFF